jgi:hypothetical protein
MRAPDYSAAQAADVLGIRWPTQLHNDRLKHDMLLDLDAGELRILPPFADSAERKAFYQAHTMYCPKWAAIKFPDHDWRFERAWIDELATMSALERAVIFQGALARAEKTLSEALGRVVRAVSTPFKPLEIAVVIGAARPEAST